jgi:LSD1 subclass zinc finger protein
MSTGTVEHPAALQGAFDPTRTNYFCGSCRSFVQAPPGASAMRACPTSGCTRPTGFGVYVKVSRPRTAVRIPAP